MPATEDDSENESLLPKDGISSSNASAFSIAPEMKASWLSRLTFAWVSRSVWFGYRTQLTLDDLWPLKPEDAPDQIANNFSRHFKRSQCLDSRLKDNTQHDKKETINNYKEQKEEEEKEGIWKLLSDIVRSPGLIVPIWNSFGATILLFMALSFINTVLGFVSPLLLRNLIGFMSNSSNKDDEQQSILRQGILTAFRILLLDMIWSLVSNQRQHLLDRLIARIHSALTSTIYRKSLNSSTIRFTTGELINLMSSDATRLTYSLYYIDQAWSLPFKVVACTYLLAHELGWSMTVGIMILLALIPVNWSTTNRMNQLYRQQYKHTDERIKLLTETFGGIRVIKLYGWEVPFIGRIAAQRTQEVDSFQGVMKYHALNCVANSGGSILVSLTTFGAYILSNEQSVLTPQKVFICISMFSRLRGTLSWVSTMVTGLSRSAISMKRVNRFLYSSEMEKYVEDQVVNKENAVEIANGCFAWDDAKSTLSEIDLEIKKGSLVAIVGQVGAGKSSVLAALLGEIPKRTGIVRVDKQEQVALVTQQAWIRNATLRDNILFGLPYDKNRYEAVIAQCELKPDLVHFPAGDLTEIGEKGINLSGGQKQRVAIARAAYASAASERHSLILLDDPLSAVDSHVAQHIFTQLISNKIWTRTGYLRDKTRVLVTSSLTFLPQVDQILVLTNGIITEFGSYQELRRKNGIFAKLTREHSLHTIDSTKQKSYEQSSNEDNASQEQKAKSSTLIEEESTEGHVKWSIFLSYLKTIGPILVLAIFVSEIASQALSTSSEIWLAQWANDGLLNGTTNVTLESPGDAVKLPMPCQQRLLGYALIGVGRALLLFLSIYLMAKGILKSSSSLHGKLLNRVMRAPMQFFDTTPLGRIVNRFQKDIDAADSGILWNIDNFFGCILSALGCIYLFLYKSPLLLLIIGPISIVYFLIQKIFTATSRQLSQLRSKHRAPIISHFAETLSGRSTIRAFGATERFISQATDRLANYQRVDYQSFTSDRWLSLLLELCGSLVELAATLMAVMSRGTLEAGFVSLLVSRASQITGTLSRAVRCTSSVEKSLLSVERIQEYCEMSQEADWTREPHDATSSLIELPDNWPERGEIEFTAYSLRYREGLDLVLKNINLRIEAGQRVGIVGRTGAGKSSLMLGLFRIIEAASGEILIDGVPIQRIGLHELRSQLSIIPQDPVLFSGTIRINLDPFGVYRDELLLEALEQCHLSSLLADKAESGLDYTIAENGANLSVGQRQLICLARALLRRTRILVLDEATAAIDIETDTLIQHTIRTQFSGCTVLTVAHRLNTILDSDRVLVLDQGHVAEFDSPTHLLTNHQSLFHLLAKDAGIVSEFAK